MLLSPTLFILWGAIGRVGLTWSLLLIPVGGIVGFVLMAIAGNYFYEFMIWLEDRQTGPPESRAVSCLKIIAYFWAIIFKHDSYFTKN
ncbi:MAG: hypothetical protein ACKPEN_23590 [Planktothrix sp.]|uniref:hypothetical protein n=1 Tax=Planktothrix sp. TaxID=3088171 RepID=UPI0038D46E67